MKWLVGGVILAFLMVSVAASALVRSGAHSAAAQGVWIAAEQMDTPRRSFGAAGTPEEIHVFGGRAGVRADHDAFDGSHWSTGLDPIIARNELVGAEVDGKIYAIGGDTTEGCCLLTGVNEEYDPATDTWTSRSSMPTPRELAAAAVLDGTIYVIGGNTSNGGGGWDSVVEAYVPPPTDSWLDDEVADLNVARGAAVAAVANGKVYAIGGINDSGTLAVVEEYDPAGNEWDILEDDPLPSPRTGAMAAELNGKIYVFGGFEPEPGSAVSDDVFEFNPFRAPGDKWREVSPMPTARAEGAAITFGCIYVVGGNIGSSQETDVVEAFCPDTVGGVAELPETAGAPLEAQESSGGNAGLLAGMAAAAAAAGAIGLGSAVWYARRRWGR